MKIFDCFIFYNENLLTEIRLNILYDHVDYFVLCESKYDHRGTYKGYNFDLEKFNKFRKKIIYLQLDNFPENLGNWERQDYQRDYMKLGLKKNGVKDEDLIIYSDADEIINPKIFKKFDTIRNNVGICQQYCFYYKLNLISDEYKNYWQGSRFALYRQLKSFSWLRNITTKNLKYSFFRIDKFKKIKIYENSGWHFSYLMDAKQIQQKISSWTHSEFDKDEFKSLDKINQNLKNQKDLYGRDINFTKVDFNEKVFPDYLISNKALYKEWII